MSLPLVQCLTCTYGRFNFLRAAVGYFMVQDYPRKQLLILNNHPTPIRCDLDGVTVFNEPSAEPGIPRNRLLAKATAEFIHTWDDDDRWLPWHLSAAIEQVLASGKAAWKPARSYMLHLHPSAGGKYEMASNNFEASMIVRRDYVLKVGYAAASGDEHVPLLDALRRDGQLAATEMGARSSYIYAWRGDYSHASAALARDQATHTEKETFLARDRAWRAQHNDTGHGKPLTPADVTPMLRHFAECCNSLHDAAGVAAIRESLKPWLPPGTAKIEPETAVVATPSRSAASGEPPTRIITDWSSTDIMREVKPGGNYLIHAPRGLGDAVMSWPVYEELMRRRPDCKFTVSLYPGHHVLFPGAVPCGLGRHPQPIKNDIPNPENYDAVFVVGDRMEETEMTKQQVMARHEFGFPWPKPLYPEFAEEPSPFVGLHFHGSIPMCPTTVRPPEDFCHAIWDEVGQAGLIPLDLEFPNRPPPDGPAPIWNWQVQARQFVTPAACNAHNLLAMVQRCRAAIVIDSAPFHFACACKLPVMLIRNRILMPMGDQGWPQVDPRRPFPKGAVVNWLKGLK